MSQWVVIVGVWCWDLVYSRSPLWWPLTGPLGYSHPGSQLTPKSTDLRYRHHPHSTPPPPSFLLGVSLPAGSCYKPRSIKEFATSSFTTWAPTLQRHCVQFVSGTLPGGSTMLVPLCLFMLLITILIKSLVSGNPQCPPDQPLLPAKTHRLAETSKWWTKHLGVCVLDPHLGLQVPRPKGVISLVSWSVE